MRVTHVCAIVTRCYVDFLALSVEPDTAHDEDDNDDAMGGGGGAFDGE